MIRYFFEIAYRGSAYNGWQSQANAPSIQAVVEDALSKILRHDVKIVGSGRTDTGVHCKQQFFHTDLSKEIQPDTLRWKLNAFLPDDIAIRSIRKVKPDAHARFSATQRSYEYHINYEKEPFQVGLTLQHHKTLDVEVMNRAADLLVGEHDFTSFSKVKTDVNNFRCTITEAYWKEHGTSLVFHISANRFLRGMVRAIVGTLLEVGQKKITVQDFKKIIESKDRKKAGANVSPDGLFLTKVKYPSSIFSKD